MESVDSCVREGVEASKARLNVEVLVICSARVDQRRTDKFVRLSGYEALLAINRMSRFAFIIICGGI